MSKTDLKIGEVFNYLTVVGKTDRRYYYIMRCACGNTCEVRGDAATRTVGPIKSCGCKKSSLLSKAQFKHGQKRDRTPEYAAWSAMRQRCLNKGATSYKSYGGRGISVCERWTKFENFFADMGKRPVGYSLERNNTFGSYEPSNCRWAHGIDQARNRRTNVWIEVNGYKIILTDALRLSGIYSPGYLAKRKAGLTPQDIFGERLASICK